MQGRTLELQMNWSSRLGLFAMAGMLFCLSVQAVLMSLYQRGQGFYVYKSKQ